MAHALQIDTLAYATKLKDAGLKESHAHAIVEVFSSVDTSEFATKTDIADLKTDMAELKTDLKTDMAELKTDLKTDMADLKVEIKESQNTLIKWMVGSMIALGGLIIASNLI